MMDQLLGRWTLQHYEWRYEDGAVRLPFGETPYGQLMYLPDGFMSVQITRPHRLAFASGDWLRGTPDEIRAAYESYLAYCGKYSVDVAAGTVTHHISACTIPNWTGIDMIRYFTLEDNRLTLNSPPLLLGGGVRRGLLIWERDA